MKFIFSLSLLFVIVFFVLCPLAESLSGSKNTEKGKALPVLKKGEPSCQKKGKRLLFSKNYEFTNPLNFSSQSNEWVDQSLSYAMKNKSERCSAPCKQINNYQVSSRIYPQKVKKNSCPEWESKETYSFNKNFAFKNKKKAGLKSAHKDMIQWIVSTFVNPYYPIPFLELSEDSIKNNIGSACPSCSFYFEYRYKYKDSGQLNLDITAKCGDEKVFLSPFKMEFRLFNYWECRKDSPGSLKKIQNFL